MLYERVVENLKKHRVSRLIGIGEKISDNLRHWSVSYTHLRAHETVLDLVCRLLLEKKNNTTHTNTIHIVANSIGLRYPPP